MVSGSKSNSDRRGGNRRNNDRRNNSNRRKSDDRRAEKTKEKKSAKTRKKAIPIVSKAKKFFKLCIFLLTLFVIIATGIVVYVFNNLDYYVAKVSRKVIIKLENASIDPSKLTSRVCESRIKLGIKNNLPIDIILQNLKYDVELAEYKIAKGVQINKIVVIPAAKYKRMGISFHVDSIKTRRALRKLVQKNAVGILQIMLSKLKNKTRALSNDVKELVHIKGTANFKISYHGIELPFSKTINFNK